jgi:hypothetical protein
MSTLSDAKLQKLNELVGIHAMDIILALFLLVALILSAIAYGSLRTLGNTDYKYDDKNVAPTSYTNSKRSSLGLLIMVLLAMIFLAYDLFKKHKSVQTLAEVSIKQLIRNRY